MKRYHLIMILGILLSSFGLNAQEKNEQSEERVKKQSYYEQRAKEDAIYEQSLKKGELEDEEAFWDSQQAYEKNLKKRDRKAYRAYMKGKRAAYAAHADYCDHHHHHSAHFYYYADHYYSSPRYHYHRPNNYTVGTRVRVTPNVGIRVGGIF